MLNDLRKCSEVPVLAFDFKGDLSEPIAKLCSASVVVPPEQPVPLDVLHVAGHDEVSVKKAASRIRD